ncbi:hypothetical protein [Actibacterium lipolyticum]|uniref:Uncharacterized protein n=1 Tax=Actibacterium lipolyticum TaxID=1524263 RepID=A0A238JJ60_9RHOB|nr:hypothetical protein [Actibacterium lipolyticum]SMX30711.1 hypothetical protein COL8621_00072 [Actibacterium lipolyticum]
MTGMVLTKRRIFAGVWEGLLTGAPDDAPNLQARYLDTLLDGVQVTAIPDAAGEYTVSVPIPSALLGDGVQTIIILNGATGETLDSFSIVTGEPLEDDIRAEVDLLRAELDMLKKSFRRHCVETS